jgi:hypothetical protein
VADTAVRPWCARACYPGLDDFLIGTVTMPADAMSHEIEAKLMSAARTILPPGFIIIDIACGDTSLFHEGTDD